MADRSFALRLLRIFAWVALSVVVLVVLSFLGARAYFSDRRLTELIPAILSEELAGDFAIEHLDWTLPLTIDLYGVEVKDPEGTPVLTAGEVHAKVALWPLIRKEIRITDVISRDVDVKLFPPPPGEPSRGPVTLADAFRPAEQTDDDEPDPTKEAPTVSVLAKSVENVSISARYENLSAETKNVDIRGAFFRFGPENIEAAATVRIDEVKLRKKQPGPDEHVELGPIMIALDAARFQRAHADGTMSAEVAGATISGLSSRLEISGNVQGLPENPEGEAEGTLQLALEDRELRSLLPDELLKQLDPHGRARIRFDAKGSKRAGEGRFELEGTELTLAGTKVEKLELQAEIEEQVAKIKLFDLYLDPAEKGKFTARGDLAITQPFAHKLEIKASDIPVRKIAGRFIDPADFDASLLPATATATATVEGKGFWPLDTQVTAEARVLGIPRALSQGLFSVAFVRASGHVTETQASITQLYASSNSITVRGRGTVPFSPNRAMSFSVEARDDRPSAHFKQLELPLFARFVTLTANAKGTFKRPVVTGVVAASGVRVEQTPPGEARLPVTLADGVLTVDQGVLDIAGGRVRLNGKARLLDDSGRVITEPAFEATAGLSAVHVEPFTQDRVAGVVSGNARFQGRIDDFTARAELDAESLTVAGVTLAVSRIVLEGDENALVLRPLRIVPSEGGVLIAEGKLNTVQRTFEADVRGKDIPGLLISALIDQEPGFDGMLALGAHAKGPLLRPTITATAAVTDLVFDGIEIDQVTADLSTDLENIRGKISARAAAGKLDAEGTLAIDSQVIEARVRGIDLDVRKLPGFPARDVGLDGKLGIDLYATGKLPIPVLSGTIGVRDLRLNEQKMGNGRLEATVKTDNRGRWVVAMTALGAVRGSATLARVENPARGRLPIAGDAVVEFDRLQLAELIPSLAANGVQISTVGRADLQIGKSAAPVTGELSLVRLDAKFGQETLSASRPIIVRWDGENFVLEPMTLAGTTGELNARGRYGDTLDLHADGTIQLAFIEPLVPKVARIEGRTRLTLDIRGDRDNPRIEGEILLLSPATIRPRGMVREMVISAARILLRPGVVKIDQLQGKVSGGEFAARGELGINGLKPVRWDLRFDGSNLPYRTQEILIEADASLRATGTGIVPRISGDIEIIRGRYLRKFRLEQFVFVQRGEEEDEAEEVEPNPYLQELELDIHARSAGAIKLKIDAQAFATEMDLAADVFVRGTAALPLLDGRVISESGWLKFPAAKLDVEQLVVDFKPTLQESIHPLIDLVATGEVTAAPSAGESRPTPYDVTVHIEGPLNGMKLDLTSDPNLPQDEVLSLVVLGQADPTVLVQTSATKGSGTIESSLVFAGSQLATPVTRFVEKQLEERFNLGLQLGTEVSSERFRLTAAKELTSRFRIEGGYERLFTESAELMTGRALLFLSNDLFIEGAAQNVTAFNTTSDLETGTSGQLELKLRILGE